MPKQQILVRKMKETDLDQVMEIETATFADAWTRSGFEEEMKQTYTCYLCAEDQLAGRIAGYCGYIRSFEEADICNVAVREEYRNRGIGELMLKELMRLGREDGIEAFTLEVRRSNLAARRLYEKLGFVTEGVRKNFYALPTEDALIQWKRG